MSRCTKGGKADGLLIKQTDKQNRCIPAWTDFDGSGPSRFASSSLTAQCCRLSFSISLKADCGTAGCH